MVYKISWILYKIRISCIHTGPYRETEKGLKKHEKIERMRKKKRRGEKIRKNTKGSERTQKNLKLDPNSHFLRVPRLRLKGREARNFPFQLPDH